MTVAAVGFGPLGLPRGAFSGSAAVGWNSALIVVAGGGESPGGPVEKGEAKKESRKRRREI